MESSVNFIIHSISENLSQKSASRKDEISVMQALLNDAGYCVENYKKDTVDNYYPGQEIKKVISNVVSSVTHIPKKEASELVGAYEFTKSDAASMVDFSKEFINSYLQTGRKLPLGGRRNSNIELLWKEIPERYTSVPTKEGTTRDNVLIPAHGGIRVSNPCPKWLY